MLKRLGLILLVMMALIPATFPAYACSGGAPFEGRLREDQAFVRAEVLRVDSYGQNVILRVYEVLYGDAPETLLLVRNEPGQTIGVFEGFLGQGDCNFLEPPLSVGEIIYTTLWYGNSMTIRGGSDIYKFETPDSTVKVYKDTYDEAGLRALIEEQNGQTPHAPTPAPYPRFAALEITTEDGRYVLPTDNRPAYPIDAEKMDLQVEFGFWTTYMDFTDAGRSDCTPETCVMSADGGMVAQRGEDLVYLPMGGGSARADAFALSPVSGWIAILLENEVRLYSTGFFRTGRTPYNPLLMSVLYVERDISRAPSDDLVWSADGMQLAYADSAGVWVWDVTHWVMAAECDCSDPFLTHILTVDTDESLARPTAFSPTGDLVRVEQDGVATWIQVTDSQHRYSDGSWSMDDRILITEENGIPQFCTRSMYFLCQAQELFVKIADERLPARVRDVAWHSPFEMTLWLCAIDAPDTCSAERYQSHGYWHRAYESNPIADVRLFEYQPALGHLAVVSGDSLLIDNKPVNLTGVEGKITGLRWLRPLWTP